MKAYPYAETGSLTIWLMGSAWGQGTAESNDIVPKTLLFFSFLKKLYDISRFLKENNENHFYFEYQ